MSQQPLVFKIASEDWEFEAIHHLNYKTFVEEIPQHAASPSKRLVDKFHNENTYLTCFSGRKLVGMMAVRGNRPFSLDGKLERLDSYLPPGRKICEIRLLATEKKYRGLIGGQVLGGILALLWQHGMEQGYDLAIISGTTRQERLYRHIGFTPFGPLVGKGDAVFQPMFITLETFESAAKDFLRDSPTRAFQTAAANFLPGPVAIPRVVKRAFEQTPESHRTDVFVSDFQAAKQALCKLTRSAKVEILLGSGSLANDAVAAQLSLAYERGLILVNGEFGERLVDHARRLGLEFDTLSFEWGDTIDFSLVERQCKGAGISGIENQKSGIGWLWCAHCETSTGVLNDLDALKKICADCSIKLCLDAISSIGTLPVDLSGVHLASCASGKGLRSYSGLALVFYHHELATSPRLPRYLDLGHYAQHQGIAFTHSSNLVHALHASLKHTDWEKHFTSVAEVSAALRTSLRGSGFSLIDVDGHYSPAIITIVLPAELDSAIIGGQLMEAGYLLSYNSDYLRRRNWIQIGLMGEIAQGKLASLASTLHRICFTRMHAETVMG
ncbi:MAG: aminotransferase V [Planctomycetes bacterium]|nr:aminotransferase V [Planctomycetota bacterium]